MTGRSRDALATVAVARLPRTSEWCWRERDRPLPDVHERRGCREWCSRFDPEPAVVRRRKAA